MLAAVLTPTQEPPMVVLEWMKSGSPTYHRWHGSGWFLKEGKDFLPLKCSRVVLVLLQYQCWVEIQVFKNLRALLVLN